MYFYKFLVLHIVHYRLKEDLLQEEQGMQML